MMPLNPILTIEIFDVWVEAVPCKTNDHKIVVKFLKENIFSRFGTPRTIISDNGTHFCNRSFETLMKKYSITHKLSTPYHPQTCRQVEVSNHQIKQILEKTVKKMERLVLEIDRRALGLPYCF